MTTDRDDAQLRRYRQASAALDERPSAAARAAILAAAARHVEATPQPADAARPAQRRRWPLAAAAAVLLSTLAVMLATRTEQEMPRFTAPPERGPEPAPAAPASSAPPIAVTPSSSASSAGSPPAPTAEKAPAPARSATPSPRTQKEGARQERAAPPSERFEGREAASDVAADRRDESAAPVRPNEAAAVEEQRALPAAPPAPPPPAAKRTGPPAVGSLGAGDAGNTSGAAKPEAARSAERSMRREAAPAAQALPVPEPASAQEWLERIVRLRSAGRHEEADADLRRFRERYPDVQVPAAALPPGPAGTR